MPGSPLTSFLPPQKTAQLCDTKHFETQFLEIHFDLGLLSILIRVISSWDESEHKKCRERKEKSVVQVKHHGCKEPSSISGHVQGTVFHCLFLFFFLRLSEEDPRLNASVWILAVNPPTLSF